VTLKKVLELIEAKRSELNKVVAKNGLNAQTTLKYSQQLDQLINQYNQLTASNNKNFYIS